MTRRTLVVTGRQGTHVTIVVEVRRGKVWVVAIDPPFGAEAIFEPAQVESFIDLLSRAAQEARGGATDHTPGVQGLAVGVLPRVVGRLRLRCKPRTYCGSSAGGSVAGRADLGDSMGAAL